MPEPEERPKRPAHQKDSFKNPCFKEQAMSFKCLDENNFNKEKCTKFFQNYKNCQDFWSKIRNERRRQGIEPYLPFPEDREKIKSEYMKNRQS
ncbi:coiled-coil-helix-coiled-coil-helix domain-containing protein 7 [Ischnura elegans]|uniref:coiled-coil-helix-coiled-coil-helix domain-containing protein 7 n=1 Tax=Ischnura elegans TaxID=197161 RepID=UPI001ED8696A|nr:coiled-coil-helix-coiled-coil-helix domain-containing protein 7 [Ischnura elegans]